MDEDEDDASQGSNLQQKEKIAFLVNSMDTLKQTQKDLIRDNTDLHCEIPRVKSEAVFVRHGHMTLCLSCPMARKFDFLKVFAMRNEVITQLCGH